MEQNNSEEIMIELTQELKEKVQSLVETMEGDIANIPDSNNMVLVRENSEELEKRKGKVLIFPSPVAGFVICTN
jgi:hypothetical protein